jgi:DNA-binding NtrC family response regulator
MAPIHLLLVDDEKDFIETVAQRLNNKGFKTTVVFNSQAAIEKNTTDETIDVIIMDISMPGIDGLESLQEIKKKRPLIEIIMLTGHATIQSAIEAMKFGAFDYLRKPCELDTLITKVNAAASRKKDRENKIFEIRIKPYITKWERDEMISRILES